MLLAAVSKQPHTRCYPDIHPVRAEGVERWAGHLAHSHIPSITPLYLHTSSDVLMFLQEHYLKVMKGGGKNREAGEDHRPCLKETLSSHRERGLQDLAGPHLYTQKSHQVLKGTALLWSVDLKSTTHADGDRLVQLNWLCVSV